MRTVEIHFENCGAGQDLACRMCTETTNGLEAYLEEPRRIR